MRKTAAQTAEEILDRLDKWKPYVYHRALTGSIYIKFPHWGLGSIRVADHKGRSKYRYRWICRVDWNGKSHSDMYKGTPRLRFSPDSMDQFVDEFETQAKERGIKPGESESWEERITNIKIGDVDDGDNSKPFK